MKIVGLCPTYRRSQLIPNVLAMWQAQDWPGHKKLIILDDAGEFKSELNDQWWIIVRSERYKTLGSKFNYLLTAAHTQGATHVVLFEDDDVYGPGYLSAHAAAFEKSDVSMPSLVLSNDNLGPGKWHDFDARGRNHGSWGYSLRVAKDAGGYNPDLIANFDVEFGGRLRKLCKPADPWPGKTPQYVYRWFTVSKNGSAFGEKLLESQDQASNPEVSQKPLTPAMDDEAKTYYRDLWRVPGF